MLVLLVRAMDLFLGRLPTSFPVFFFAFTSTFLNLDLSFAVARSVDGG
jgi:hypothetical protein